MAKKPKLKLVDRLEIKILLDKGYSYRAIARSMGRSPNTISYEVEVNGGILGYNSQNADIYAALVIPGNQPGGDVANVITPCPDNTSRNQLQVKFTPSSAGVFVVEAWAYWLANLADENVIIDDIAISQV